MTKTFEKSEQRGTLLIEALAMLGLIAMVTPTLYKKSAERLQEIQDINGATQARTMSNVMDAYIQANFSELMLAMSSGTGTSTVVIDYDDNKSGAFKTGYSSYLPYGYKPDEIRNYGDPKVYVHRDKDTLVSYVLYPKVVDLGPKRSARMASLVGANGGVISEIKEAKGTGGAWYLDSSMVDDLGFEEDLLTENSLIVTSNEPISMSYDDSAKYLYRVPPTQSDADSEYFHNTMVTDLYMGGHEDLADYAHLAKDYYSIFNVRKLTMNTNCNRQKIGKNIGGSSLTCDPNVADLYIGKPIAWTLNKPDHDKAIEANNGAAWIYGNLAALNENFRLFRDGAGTGYDTTTADRLANSYDVMQFARLNNSSGTEEVVVLRAENKNTGTGARVAMIDDFVQVTEGSTGMPEFLVGGSTGTMVKAFQDKDNGSKNSVFINKESASSVTSINQMGGIVRINEGSTIAETYINTRGGLLKAGDSSDWIDAAGKDNSSQVYLLTNYGGVGGNNDNRKFAVGSQEEKEDHMIWADRKKVSLRNGGLRVYSKGAEYNTTDGLGGRASNKEDYADINGELTGLTAIASHDTDIFGATYIGTKAMASNGSSDGTYTRGQFVLGVAGSAWIDDMLWARKAWLHNAGMKELHAGFKNFQEYNDKPQTAWLNVYDDMVVIRNKSKGGDNASRGDMNTGKNDLMLQADSSKIVLNDTAGAWAWLEGGSARVGTAKNFFFADGDNTGGNGSANVIGSTLANIYTANANESSKVNIQRDAMMFGGHWDSSYANTIAAKTGLFTIKTTDENVSSNASDNVQFMANKEKIRTRYVDFMVEDNSSKARFKVSPNLEPYAATGEANVLVDGSFHVTGNDVIHIANNPSKSAENDSSHAMFEIDPKYVAVWSKDSSGKDGNYVGGSSASSYYAMLKINPTDTKGTKSAASDTRDASIYVRKGAIELEDNYKNTGSSGAGFAADEGFGYIKANRFVSNTGENVPQVSVTGFDGGTPYDQYMVNPAYTSVMHDIKLTTRGGARLSDALPDFVLKGVYNVNNNCVEGDDTSINCKYKDYDKWASPYLGMVPYASCPPGYRNMATVVPVSFLMGQAGDLVVKDGHWVINPYQRQSEILKKAGGTTAGLIYPGMQEVSSLVYNGIYQDGTTHSSFLAQTMTRTEGWFMGLKAIYADASAVSNKNSLIAADMDPTNITTYTYVHDNGKKYSVAQPLYFQQNNWLKTSLDPETKGWKAYMGFLYDTGIWGNSFTVDGVTNTGQSGAVRSNQNDKGYNDKNGGGGTTINGYVWNLFPVPTNMLEGHATVYCYFDRTVFDKQYVDQIDQLGALTGESGATYREIGKKPDSDYTKRLNDPTLKYSDPW